jgi:Zn-dependent protease
MENALLKVSILLVPIMFAVVCHEVAHGFVAWRYGDPTARMLGRLTLNPIKHVDIIGSIIVPAFLVLSHSGILFGWAKPVPVIYENLRNPKKDMIWVAAAGPITNVIIAILSAIMLRGTVSVGNPAFLDSSKIMFLEPIILMLAASVYFNLLLAIFNMFPLPPLDGGRVLTGLLPHRLAISFAKIERHGFVILMVVLFILPSFLGIDVFRLLIYPVLNFGILLLAGPQAGLVLSVMRL